MESDRESRNRHVVAEETTTILSVEIAETEHPSHEASITSLPTELILKIFASLNRVASTCLGLTCKCFYAIHKSLHPKVPLVSYVQPSRNRIYESTDSLFIRLKGWMAPDYAFDHSRKRFVRVDPEAMGRRDAYESSREVLERWKRRSRDVVGNG